MKRTLERAIAASLDDAAKPVAVDAWIANSLLQKSIRRGDESVARRAALTFHNARGAAIWRRLVIIAFEDIGASSPSTVSEVVRLCSSKALRRETASEQTLARAIATILAAAVKSRTAEHLVTVAKFHPSLHSERVNITKSDFVNCLAVTMDNASPPEIRGLSLWRASSIGAPEQINRAIRLNNLFAAFQCEGVPAELIDAAQVALTKVRDPIVLMAGLACLLAKGQWTPVQSPAPDWIDMDGVPSYALDKHTLLGRSAIRNLIKHNSAIRTCLERFTGGKSVNDAGYMSAFYTDAAPLARRLEWEGATALEQLAIEADLMRVGVSAEGVRPVLEVFREHLDDLNRARAELFFRARESVNAGRGLAGSQEGTP